MWEILDTGVRSAVVNMQIDSDLLDNIGERQTPLIHFYEWEGDSATYGYFVKPESLLDLGVAEERSLVLARRSTGGGIVFHLWDMAFSVLVPSHCAEFSMNTLDNYAFVNGAVLGAVEQFFEKKEELSLIPEDALSKDMHCKYFCMAKPTKYDVMWQGRKIAGAAQRKTRGGFLHQGTISLVMPSQEYLSAILLPGTEVIAAMGVFTHPLLGKNATRGEMEGAKERLRKLLATHLNEASLKCAKVKTEGIYVG